jgi:Carboxypeptidase regulatory-like domain/TonB dependent receptor
MRQRWVVASALAVLAVVGMGSILVLKAGVTGSISGAVTDPSGAAVPAAKVILRNSDTGLVLETRTGSDGSYEFLVVPVGEHYILQVAASGFKTYTQTGITLLVNQRLRADARLAVGTETQTVEVAAQGVQVATQSTQMGDVIGSNKMLSLPLNGRSYIDLLGLQGGVVPQTTNRQLTDRPVAGDGDTGNFSVDGGREAANGFFVNGATVEEARNNGVGLVPDLDSIQEFRVLTDPSDAEYGGFAGAVVNVITKSGTNQWHGSAFEFVRNTDFDARNFFDINRGVFDRNQFGATVGGPIRKDRWFIFADYQGTRQSRGLSTGLITVPTLAQRAGDVSGLITPTALVKGDNVPNNGTMEDVLTQRLGYTVANGEPYDSPGCTSTSQCVFPGGVIPTRAWDPVAKGTLRFIPLPNAGPSAFSAASSKLHLRDDKSSVRTDYTSQAYGNWSAYYSFDGTTLNNPFPGTGANVPGFAATNPQRAQQAVLSNTRNFGSNKVNVAHFDGLRLADNLLVPTEGLGDIASFGFPKLPLGLIPYPTFEGVPTTSLNNLGVTFGLPNCQVAQYNTTYEGSDYFSMVRGRHTLKLGGELRRLQLNVRGRPLNGAYGFSGGETGSDFADFLLGAPDSFNQAGPSFFNGRSTYGGLYVEDSDKVKSDLTLNYGLRWEFSQWFRDKGPESACNIQALNFAEQSVLFPTAPRGLLCPGDPGIPPGLAPDRYNNFSPRVGLAYSPGFTQGVFGKIFGGPGKSSIRASYGIFYTAVEGLTQYYEVGDAPANLFFVAPTQVYLSEPYKARRSSNDPGQRFPFNNNPKTINFAQFLPITASPGFVHDNKLPYEHHYDFSIQRQIGNSSLLTMAYVGTAGHHLIAQVEANPGNAALCLATPGCGPFGEDSIYDLADGQVVNGTRPHSVTSGRFLSQGRLDFSSNDFTSTTANSDYNALQVTFERRVGAVRLLGAYTWSKSMDNASALNEMINPFDARLSRSISSFDVTHSFVLSYTWDLPFEKLTSSSAGRTFLGGWALSGITRFATGFPITLGENDDGSLCGCGGVDFPNYNDQPIKEFDPRASVTHQFFDTSPFSLETVGVAGDSARRFFYGPGINNFDMALHKMTRLTERVELEYRAEFFNAFNHAQFMNPSGTINSSTFGAVTSARDPRIIQMALKLRF